MGADIHFGSGPTTTAIWTDINKQESSSAGPTNGSWRWEVSSRAAPTPSLHGVPWWEGRTAQTYPPSSRYHLVTALLLIAWAVLGTLGNSVVLLVLGRRRRRRPPVVGAHSPTTDGFILNLAVTHLLLSLLCTPLEAATLMLGGRWVFGDVLCRLVCYLGHVLVSAAVVTLTNIAIDRYYLVVYPLKRKITTFKRRLMIGLTWGYSLIVCIPLLLAVKVTEDTAGVTKCGVGWSLWSIQLLVVMWTTLTVFLPLTVSCVAYYLVWRAFRHSQLKVNVARVLKVWRGTPIFSTTELRLLKTLLLMVFCYVTLWTPYLTCLFLWFFSYVQIPMDFVLTSLWISRAEPLLDPLIYGYLNDQFRRGLCDMFRGGEGGGAGGNFCGGWRDETPTSDNDFPGEPLSNLQEERSRSMFDSHFRHAAPPAPPPGGHVPTVTCHDGQTHAQTVHDELFLSMDAYIRRTSYPTPRISRVSVKELTEVSSTKAQSVEEVVATRGRVRNVAAGGNQEDHMLEMKQIPRRQDPLRLRMCKGLQTTEKEISLPAQRKRHPHPSVLLHVPDPPVLNQVKKSKRTSVSRVNVVCPAPPTDADQCPTTSGLYSASRRLPPICSQRSLPYKTTTGPTVQQPELVSVPAVAATSDKDPAPNGVLVTAAKPRRKRRKILSKRIREKKLKSNSENAHVS